MKKPGLWMDNPNGSVLELVRGLRIVVTLDRKYKLYRISFAGIASTLTSVDLDEAKHRAIWFANKKLSEILLKMLEITDDDLIG